MRENVGEHLPDFITPGVTTKEDVLMHLGEADNVWPETQLRYYTAIGRGGFGAVLPAPIPSGTAGFGSHRQLWRTLIVEFDNAEFVTSAHLQIEMCAIRLVRAGARVTEKMSCVPVEKATTPGIRPKAGAPEGEH
jgi:hypothetical protein